MSERRWAGLRGWRRDGGMLSGISWASFVKVLLEGRRSETVMGKGRGRINCCSGLCLRLGARRSSLSLPVGSYWLLCTLMDSIFSDIRSSYSKGDAMIRVDDDVAVILEGNRKLFLVLWKGDRWHVASVLSSGED